MARMGRFSGEELNVSASSVWTMLLDLLNKIKKFWFIIIITCITIGLTAVIEFLVPQLIQFTIDKAIPTHEPTMLVKVAAGFLIAALGLAGLGFVSSYLLSLLGQRAIFSIRNDLYTHLIDQDIEYFDRNRTGDLMSRLTNDVNALQKLISSDLLDIVTSIGVFIVVSAYMFSANWQLTAALYVTFPFFILITKFFSKKIRKVYGHVQISMANMTNHLQDSLTSVRLMKSFTNEGFEVGKFKNNNEANMDANLNASYLSSMYGPLIGIVNSVGFAMVIVMGAWFAMEGTMTTGAIFAFVAYLKLVQAPITKFTKFIRELQQAAASYDRIMEVMNTEPKIKNNEDGLQLPEIKGEVRYENVNFSYDGKTPILKNVNLTLKQGQMTAIVGSSGSGKTTMSNLLQRFYDPTEGQIKIDGTTLKEVQLQSLRKQIVVVAQDIQLFSGTLKENIAYGYGEATDEQIEAAARAANAHEFISEFPEGYLTQIGERGVKLSGGQKQRISIARALLKNPNLIVLDEATAALDTESEKLIQNSLNTLLKDKTSLVIAHRLSTIRMADQIVVLEKGEIVECGSHDELIAKSGRYRELYEYQFPQEQIAV
ncbi:MAG: ABC transporter ATP-binding protein [Kurthia sp.]|nr:ABC transporter ATP-binding protein [Candidatus Kurthia equi]